MVSSTRLVSAPLDASLTRKKQEKQESAFYIQQNSFSRPSLTLPNAWNLRSDHPIDCMRYASSGLYHAKVTTNRAYHVVNYQKFGDIR